MINYKLTPGLASAQVLSVASHLSCTPPPPTAQGMPVPPGPVCRRGALTCHLSLSPPPLSVLSSVVSPASQLQ